MEEQLIEYVKLYPILYDPRDKFYRDQNARKHVWDEVGKNIGKSGNECKHLWTKLRNAHTNALRRRLARSGQTVKKIPKWKFEDQMSFVRASSMEQKDSLDHTDSEADEPVECILKEEPEDISTMEADRQQYFNSASNGISTKASEFQTSTPLTKPQAERQLENIVQLMSNKLSHQLVDFDKHFGQDEVDLFFLSLAKTVKKLNREEQIRVKIEVSNIVFQAELMNV